MCLTMLRCHDEAELFVAAVVNMALLHAETSEKQINKYACKSIMIIASSKPYPTSVDEYIYIFTNVETDENW